MSDTDDLWEANAEWWQQGYTAGADPEYEEQIIPLVREHLGPAERVLDIGCGEGQIARVAKESGASVVVGVDPTRAQVVEAVRRGGGPLYARGGADAVCFADASFDAVIACLVFEHIVAVDAALDEVGRLLRPGGRLLLFLNHPLLQTPGSGWIDDHILDPPEQYWRVGPYLVESVEVEEIAKDVYLPYVHRPLSRYVNGLVDAGLTIERMLEPGPPQGFLDRAPEYHDAATIPRLLFLRCRKAET